MFKKIEEFGFKYEISSKGTVRNIKSKKELRPELTRNGYLRVTLTDKNIKKHFLLGRLVLKYWGTIPDRFIGCNISDLQVNHKDGNKQNNDINNLERVSAKENCFHRDYILNHRNEKLDLTKKPKKKIKCVELDMIFDSSYSAAYYIKFNLQKSSATIRGIASSLRECARGLKKRAYSLTFIYI